MTDAKKKALIVKLVRDWQVPLFLNTWRFKIYFPSKIKEVASCQADSEYLTAALCFNLKRLPDTEDELRELVVHEMTHCHVNALATVAERGAKRNPERMEAVRLAEEELVTRFSRILLPHLP